jgi:hypothetical protein
MREIIVFGIVFIVVLVLGVVYLIRSVSPFFQDDNDESEEIKRSMREREW